jgi:cysteine sulfinate desulfinase/cysteine desulfurase-like protein
MKTIYLDFNASTPIAPEVADAMRPFLSEHYGNPSSQHWAGVPAKAALERALNVSFVDRLGSDVLRSLEGVAASTGSACHSGRHELSPVLKAMGVEESAGLGAVRFSLGRGMNIEELDHVLRLLRPASSTRGLPLSFGLL